MEKLVDFHTVLPLSSRLCGRWTTSLIPFSLVCLPLSAIQNKIKAPTEQGKNPRGKCLLSKPDRHSYRWPHTFHSLVLGATAAKYISRVTINTLGLSGVRDPEGWQRVHELIASRRWGLAKFWLNYTHVTLPTVITPSFCRGQTGSRKRLLWVSVTREGWFQCGAQLGRRGSSVNPIHAPRGIRLKGLSKLTDGRKTNVFLEICPLLTND